MKIVDCDADNGRYVALQFILNQEICLIHCVYFPCNSSTNDYASTWNNLPTDVTSISSIQLFKRALKTYLFRKRYGV